MEPVPEFFWVVEREAGTLPAAGKRIPARNQGNRESWNLLTKLR